MTEAIQTIPAPCEADQPIAAQVAHITTRGQFTSTETQSHEEVPPPPYTTPGYKSPQNPSR